MVTLNLTFVVEVFLFLVFLAIARRIGWRPLLQLMRRRQETFENRRSAAAQNATQAQQLVDAYHERLSRTNQQAVQQKNDTIYAARRARRVLIAELKAKADLEVLEYHEALQKELVEHRKKFPEALPSLIEVMDYQIEKGGRMI